LSYRGAHRGHDYISYLIHAVLGGQGKTNTTHSAHVLKTCRKRPRRSYLRHPRSRVPNLACALKHSERGSEYRSGSTTESGPSSRIGSYFPVCARTHMVICEASACVRYWDVLGTIFVSTFSHSLSRE